MLDEPCLADASLGEKSDVATVVNRRLEFFGLELSVAKRIWPIVTKHDKWVLHFHGRYCIITYASEQQHISYFMNHKT